MNFFNKKGVVTVFVAILLPALLAGFMVLSDVVIKKTAENTVEKSAQNAAYAVLGGYSSYLMDNYGIYAYCTGPGQATETAEQLLGKNLELPGFYDFKVEEVEIVKSKNLAEEGVMGEILGTIARDSLYKGILQEFKEKLESVSGASKAADIVRHKMRFDEAVAKIKGHYERLSSLINGGEKTKTYVNFPKDSDEFSRKLAEFYGYYEKIRDVLDRMESLGDEEGKSEEHALRLISLEEELGWLRHEAADVYEKGVGRIIVELKKANRQTLETIEGILKEKVDINYISDKIRQKIDSMEDCPGYLKIILSECVETVSHMEEAFVEQVFEEITICCGNNLSYLEDVAKSFSGVIENEDFDLRGSCDFSPDDYRSDLEYSYSPSEKPGLGEDIRGFFEFMGKKVLEKRLGEDKTIPKNKVLPSASGEENGEKGVAFNVSTTGKSTEKADEQMESFTAKASNAVEKAARNLSINEYILQHFKNSTSKSGADTVDRFFKNETEYIIWGAKSQNTNLFFTKSALMGTRFALNALHVYTDSEKKIKADTIATATAGWWTAGAGIPVMSHLIKCAWAVAEAGLDVSKLCGGDAVAVVKRGGDWITDIGVNKAGPSTPDVLKMDYEDYLRLMLLTVPQRDRELRMLDIIDLNSANGFEVRNAFTQVTVKARVSCMSLTGGRHEIEVSVTKEY